ncbi:MAG: transglycosylase domain-containing protein, partial [Succinivibrionaceae bacterium]|nr:transglycosylase domain-containing protein [Succinivibrionaceae bacterium]
MRPLAAACGLGLALAALALTQPPDPPGNSRVVLDREGGILYVTNSPDGRRRIGARLPSVDPLYVRLLIAAEDERFHYHPGVDLVSVARAAGSNLLAMRTVSGASTLAMQVTRMLERNPRTLPYKIREAVGALWLTAAHGRDWILERYLTLAPMGGPLEGVHAGALAWFGHDASHLTPAEAALLAA